MPPVSGSRTRSHPSWWLEGDSVCSITGLKTAGSPRTWERTTPFSSTSSMRRRTTTHRSPIRDAPARQLHRSEAQRWRRDSLALRLVRLWSMPAVWRCAESSSTTRLRTRWGATSLSSISSRPSMSVQAGYVTSLARHLEVFPNSNNVTQIAWIPPKTRKLRTVPGLRARIELRHHQRQQLVPLAADQSGKAVCQRLELPGHLHVLQDTRQMRATCLTGEARRVSALRMCPGPASTMTMAWRLSISGTSSTSAEGTNFPSAKASGTWPRPRA